MSTRPKFFLLDAGPVIELHRLGLWSRVVELCDLVLPAVVARKEVQHWDAGVGVGRPIDLTADIDSGRVRLVEARPDQTSAVLARLDPLVRERVHQGELEAIVALAAWGDEGLPEFCTADKMAVVALCLLGLARLPVSLEELLARSGLNPALYPRFSALKMKEWVSEGRLRFMQGTGLV